ncbi:hypothetical protein H6F75_12175 [Nodosilinea sp. FACHB-131]|uniref:hypothetical protein n=1 Tax=Cyanophyceae TaxID=3028117 RepID=UPI001688574A|nr:hypothetical protein [Nodosilinea sp. FACHB-131]MBD1874243.1 hypothetical protein [Nodosilinea sp. FACHB-131]
MTNALERELYDRMAVLTNPMVKLRWRLDALVKAFNPTVGCLESRVLGQRAGSKSWELLGENQLRSWRGAIAFPAVLRVNRPKPTLFEFYPSQKRVRLRTKQCLFSAV